MEKKRVPLPEYLDFNVSGKNPAGVTPDFKMCSCHCHRAEYEVRHLAACCRTKPYVDECVFCKIGWYELPAKFKVDYGAGFIIEPLNPVTPGHLLVIPRMHIEDGKEDPARAALAAYRGLKYAEKPFNLILNVGAEATQTVFHLHWHIVPRRENDGLVLPWTNQEK